MKKLISLLLCVLLVMSLAVPAFAGEVTDSASTPGSEGSVVSDAPVTDRDEGSGASNPDAGSTDTPAPDPGTGDASGSTSGETPTEHTHSFDAGTVTTQPTCVTAGVLTQTCACGTTQTQSVAATGVHTPGPWQSVDGTNHSRSCTGCGGQTETAAHVWDGGTVTTAATCVAGGVKTFTCACGATKTETIVANPEAHTFSAWDGSTEGTHSRTCSGCGKTESGNHTWSVSATVPATCKEEGAKAYGCPTCQRIEYEILPKLTTHTYDHGCDTDCNVCGAVRETEHKYNKAWSKNSQQHWHVCSVCGDKTDVGSHYPGPAATEEKAQTCLTCGLVLTPKLNHSHDYDTQWSWDDEAHWYACDGCDEQKSYAKHTFDDGCDPDCNVCGYVTSTAHDYGGTWLSDEEGHWGECTVCGEEGTPVAHTPGPEATETEPQICTVCGFEIAPAQVHVHEAGEEWLTDDTNHWKVCECGEKVEEAPHAWDEGTENEDTTVTYVCTDCGAEKTEGEPKVDSGFPWWIVIVALAVVAAGAGVALFFVLKDGKGGGKYGK